MTIESPCELFRPLDHTQRLGRIDGPARALDDRSVNQLAAESQEPFAVVQVDPDAVNGLHVSRCGGEHYGRASINKVACFTFPYGGQTDFPSKIFSSE